jgi:hypothetical protein
MMSKMIQTFIYDVYKARSVAYSPDIWALTECVLFVGSLEELLG